MTSVPVASSLHPVLVELQWNGISTDNCHVPSALDVLNYLLETSSVAEDIVRSAYATLQKSRFQRQPTATQPELSDAVNDITSSAPPDGMISPAAAQQPHVSVSDANQTSQPRHHSVEQVRRRHIALRIYYDGGSYSGLAENVGQSNDTSIERALFAALHTARLIPCDFRQRHTLKSSPSVSDNNTKTTAMIENNSDAVSYSRCGRTDKGVSAAGQVVALCLKSAFPVRAHERDPRSHSPATATAHEMVSNEQLPCNAHDKLEVWVPARKKHKPKRENRERESDMNASATEDETVWIQKELSEYAYDKILNNLLPPDIRVLGWCPVSTDFSARFSCTRRVYRYFFVPRSTLNIDWMKEALTRMVGAHDFRNFCKMDVEKVSNFVRIVHSAEIVTVDQDTSYILIVGQAFLWHQIRCIAHVLFLVGRGLEAPSIVTELLDVAQHPGKPSYPLADERPLVLHDCQYNNLSVGYSVSNLWNLVCLQEQQWENFALAAARVRSCIQSLHDVSVSRRDLLAFCSEKLNQREKKKNGKQATFAGANGVGEVASLPETMTWREALAWLKPRGLCPEPDKSTEFVYTALLERSKGTTYEEKISALQRSAKRRRRYEGNVIDKRTSADEDAAFYHHMMKQGGQAG